MATAISRRWTLDSQLLVAIQNNDVGQAQKLFLQGADTDTRFSINSQKRPALCLCVENNAVDMVRLLVEKGASINQGDSLGYTPLHSACTQGYTALAALLLHAKANVHARTDEGCTPLLLAASRGCLELVELLLQYGSPVDCVNRLGCTPLLVACGGSSPDVVRCLLRAGASPAVRDSSGNTPLHHAVSMPDIDVETTRLLLAEYPEAASICNRAGHTPLHLAVRTKRPDAAKLVAILVGAGDRKTVLDATTPLRHTALHLAVLEKELNCIRTLLQAGASLNTRDHLGYTPLYSAARDSTRGAVALLLGAGASTRPLFHGGEVVDEVRDIITRAMIEAASSQPASLSSHCRRELIKYLGPDAIRLLDDHRLPHGWRAFFKYDTLSL